ncbi:hypothetical protein KC339_g19 [Hortaea werneckii]|nr:hypothetical protein KC339_g19 [Hortaea werneckii]
MSNLPSKDLNNAALSFLGARTLYMTLYTTISHNTLAFARTGVYAWSIGIPLQLAFHDSSHVTESVDPYLRCSVGRSSWLQDHHFIQEIPSVEKIALRIHFPLGTKPVIMVYATPASWPLNNQECLKEDCFLQVCWTRRRWPTIF